MWFLLGIVAFAIIVGLVIRNDNNEHHHPMPHGPMPMDREVEGSMMEMGMCPSNGSTGARTLLQSEPWTCSGYKLGICDGEADCDLLIEQEYALCNEDDGLPKQTGAISACICGSEDFVLEIPEDDKVVQSIEELGHDYEYEEETPGARTTLGRRRRRRRRISLNWSPQKCWKKMRRRSTRALARLQARLCNKYGKPRWSTPLANCVCFEEPEPQTGPCNPGLTLPIVYHGGADDDHDRRNDDADPEEGNQIANVVLSQTSSTIDLDLSSDTHCFKKVKTYVGTSRPGTVPSEFSPELPGSLPADEYTLTIDIHKETNQPARFCCNGNCPWQWNHPFGGTFECDQNVDIMLWTKAAPKNADGTCPSSGYKWAWAKTDQPMYHYGHGHNEGYLIKYRFCCEGACCDGDSCLSDVTADSCPGAYQGDNSVCEADTCAPPPVPCELCGNQALKGLVLDHKDGNQAAFTGEYCLRLDNFNRYGSNVVTFTCQHPGLDPVVWRYDPVSKTYTITGQIFSQLAYPQGPGEVFDLEATFVNFDCCAIHGSDVNNLCSEDNTGLVTLTAGDGTVYEFNPKDGNAGVASFIGFNHRGEELSYWGWLMGPSATGTRDFLAKLTCEPDFDPPPSPPPPVCPETLVLSVTSSVVGKPAAGSTVTLTATPSGGSGSVAYLWSTGETTSSIDVLVGGTYSVTVTDDNSACGFVTGEVVVQPFCELVVTIDERQIGGGGVVLTASPSGGISPYTYTWKQDGSPVGSSSEIELFGATPYTVSLEITDADGCEAQASIDIDAYLCDGFTGVTIEPSVQPDEFGKFEFGASVSLTAQGSGGSGSYTYIWNKDMDFFSTMQTIDILEADIYEVIVASVDPICGVASTSYMVMFAPDPSCPAEDISVSISSDQGEGPFNEGTNVQLTATIVGGTSGPAIEWILVGGTSNPIATGVTQITVSEPGTYEVKVTDADSRCGMAMDTFPYELLPKWCCENLSGGGGIASDANPGSRTLLRITVPPPPPFVCVEFATNPTDELNSGFVGCQASASCVPGQSCVASGACCTLSGGNPSCLVVDDEACQDDNQVFSIGQNCNDVVCPECDIGVEITLSSNGLSLTAQISGDSSPRTITWSGPNGFTSSTQLISPTVDGSYTVVIENTETGCVAMDTFDFVRPCPTPVAFSFIEEDTAQGSLRQPATIQSGFTFAWDPVTPAQGQIVGNQLIVTQSGSYGWTLSVTGRPECPVTTAAVVIDNVVCVGGPLSASGITEVSSPGSTELTAEFTGGSGSPTFSWSGPGGLVFFTQTITVTAPGTYTVLVEDGVCGSEQLSTTIVIAPAIGACCDQEGSTFQCTEGLEQSACSNIGDTWFEGLTCADEAMICENCDLSVSIDQDNTNGVSVDLTAMPLNAEGTVTYSWIPTNEVAETITILNDFGMVEVIATDQAGCIAAAMLGSVDVPCDPTLTGNIDATSISPIDGDTVTLTAQPMGGVQPYSYLWSTGATTTSIDVTTSGTYTVVVSDAAGCPTTQFEIQLTFEPVCDLAVTISQTTQVINLDDSATLTANPTGGNAPFSYLWSTGETTQSITVSPTADTTYTVTVSGSAGCDPVMAQGTVEVACPGGPLIVTQITQSQDPVVEGDTVTLSVSAMGGSGSPTYLWSTGETTSSITENAVLGTTYSVTVSDGVCGEETRTITLNVTPDLMCSLQLSSQGPFLLGEMFTATAIVSGGTGSATTVIDGQPGTSVTITVTQSDIDAGSISINLAGSDDGQICSDSVTVQTECDLSVVASAIVNGPSAELVATLSGVNAPGAMVEWFTDPARTIPVFDINNVGSGTYYVTVTSGSCTAEDSVEVTVQPTGACLNRVSGDCTDNVLAQDCVDPCETYTLDASCPVSPVLFTVMVIETDLTNLESATLTAVVTGSIGTPTYQWLLDGSAISGGTSPTYVASVNGLYSVVVTDAGCVVESETFQVEITCDMGNFVVGDIDVSDPAAINPSSIAPGSALTLAATPSGGSGAYSYSWSGPNGFTGSAQVVNVAESGTYVVSVTDDNNCDVAMSSTVQVCLFSAALSAQNEVNNQVLILTTAQGQTGTVDYTLNTGATSSNGFIVSTDGTYSASAVDRSTGCTAETNSVVVDIVCESGPISSTITFSPPSPVPFGTSATITVTAFGGSGSYEVVESATAGPTPLISSVGNVFEFEATVAGMYRYLVRDLAPQCGSMDTEFITIEFAPPASPMGACCRIVDFAAFDVGTSQIKQTMCEQTTEAECVGVFREGESCQGASLYVATVPTSSVSEFSGQEYCDCCPTGSFFAYVSSNPTIQTRTNVHAACIENSYVASGDSSAAAFTLYVSRLNQFSRCSTDGFTKPQDGPINWGTLVPEFGSNMDPTVGEAVALIVGSQVYPATACLGLDVFGTIDPNIPDPNLPANTYCNPPPPPPSPPAPPAPPSPPPPPVTGSCCILTPNPFVGIFEGDDVFTSQWDNTCLNAQTQTECDAAGGTFKPGQSCLENVAPLGAIPSTNGPAYCDCCPTGTSLVFQASGGSPAIPSCVRDGTRRIFQFQALDVVYPICDPSGSCFGESISFGPGDIVNPPANYCPRCADPSFMGCADCLGGTCGTVDPPLGGGACCASETCTDGLLEPGCSGVFFEGKMCSEGVCPVAEDTFCCTCGNNGFGDQKPPRCSNSNLDEVECLPASFGIGFEFNVPATDWVCAPSSQCVVGGNCAVSDPLEACCLSGGGCNDLTAVSCGNQGGVSQGPGTTCADANICPAQPSCPDPVTQAAPVSVTAPATRTTGALLSGDEVAVCDFAGAGSTEVTIRVYDAKSTTPVTLRTGSIPVAPGSTDAVFCKASPDGTTLVVLTFNSLVTADPVTFAVEQSLLVGDDPRVLTVSDSFIYIVGISSVIRYDIAVLSTSSSNAVVVPQHVAVSATEDVYVLSNDGSSPFITRLSAGAFTSPPTASVSIPVTSWAGVAVLDDGSVFVTYAAGNRDVVFFAEIYDSTLSSMPLATFSVARSVDTDIISAPIAVGSKAVAYYTENGVNTAIYFDSVAQTVVAEVATTQYLGQFTTPSEWIDGNVADNRVFSYSGDGSAVVFGESTFGLIACENEFLDSEQ